jgi:hypothetical protein
MKYHAQKEWDKSLCGLKITTEKWVFEPKRFLEHYAKDMACAKCDKKCRVLHIQ